MFLLVKLGEREKKVCIVFLCASHCTQLHTTDKYFKLFKQRHLQRAPHSSAEHGGFNFKYLSKWRLQAQRNFFISFFFFFLTNTHPHACANGNAIIMLIARAHAWLSMKISRIIDEAFIGMLNAKERSGRVSTATAVLMTLLQRHFERHVVAPN